jgi:hypothetical protein
VVLVGGGFVLAVALLAGAAWWFGLRHEGGPLDAAGATGCVPSRGSTDFSHNVGYVRNKADKEARITSVALLGAEGLRLADAVLVRVSNVALGSATAWPPPDAQVVWSGHVPAVGGRIPAAASTGPDHHWDLVLHLQAYDDRAMARIDGVQVDYRVGSRRYRLTAPFRFVVVRTGQCTDADMRWPG